MAVLSPRVGVILQIRPRPSPYTYFPRNYSLTVIRRYTNFGAKTNTKLKITALTFFPQLLELTFQILKFVLIIFRDSPVPTPQKARAIPLQKPFVLVRTVYFRIPVGGEIFRRPDRAWGPPSLLYNGYRVFPGSRKRLGCDADPLPPSSAEV